MYIFKPLVFYHISLKKSRFILNNSKNGIYKQKANKHKKELFDIMNSYLKPMRDKYDYYMAHYEQVEKILEQGEKKAKIIAQETINRVKKAVGVI